jgi:DNA-binding MarR family transcriptional regulator
MPQPKPSPTEQDSKAVAEAVERSLRELRRMLQAEAYMDETPLAVQTAMQNALAAFEVVLPVLNRVRKPSPDSSDDSANRPTRKQGQFLAYIHAYMRSSQVGLAPTHAALQHYFSLTPPSVNSMLARLEQRGYIRRTPGQARGITLTIDPELIPSLERPFQ